MTGTNQIVAKLFVIGPLELTDTSGNSFTPRSKKACALLALLALAPRRQRTRVWLRDKLWSESSERKSSTSLRQLLFELRRDLGWLFDSIIQVDRHSVTFRSNAIWIDYHAFEQDPSQLAALSISPEAELLEGIDVQDEEFEDWLMLERQIWRDKSEDLFTRAAEAPDRPGSSTVSAYQNFSFGPAPEPRVSFGVLPSIQQGCDAATAFVPDHLLEGIVKSLKELHPIDVFDLRDTTGHSDTLIGASNTDYFVRVRALQIRESLTLTFFFYTAANMSLEWSQSVQTTVDEALNLDSYLLSGFVTQNTDRVSRSLEQRVLSESAPEPKPLVAGYTALNMMFRLDDKALENAEALLAQKSSQNEALFAALKTYATSFKIGENLGSFDATSEAETDQLAREVLSQNPFNSISLACLGHTMGYIFRDYELGCELLERALKLNQNQAFVWDHYALNKLYTGDYDAAYKAAERAVYLGSYSPISYSYDTTLAMASTMLGHHRKAIVASRNALKKQPKFTAAMRYLLVNLAKTGREAEAADIHKKLLVRDPEFIDIEVQKERFRIAEKSQQSELLEAIRRFTT
ncbi:transcriptional regulator [Roseovarius sp. 2305UL8-3]|uniref:transcriptional regulator n=1 Tax=Roseovarius conchicola TaxID=3121636 RepID=UPI0035284B3D